MNARGRRIGKRTRRRTGQLTDTDGTLADAVEPADPGSIPDPAADTGVGISIGIGLLL